MLGADYEKIRKELGIGVYQMADYLGTSYHQYKKLEDGLLGITDELAVKFSCFISSVYKIPANSTVSGSLVEIVKEEFEKYAKAKSEIYRMVAIKKCRPESESEYLASMEDLLREYYTSKANLLANMYLLLDDSDFIEESSGFDSVVLKTLSALAKVKGEESNAHDYIHGDDNSVVEEVLEDVGYYELSDDVKEEVL